MEITELCNILNKTYNAKILKDIKSDEIRNFFLMASEKYKDGKKGNLALMNIIYNTFYGILPSPKFISGPMSITYQTSPVYGKYIYIFGEFHGKKNQCNNFEETKYNFMNISEYFKKIFSNTDKFIDFYLEDELFREIEPDRNLDFINMLRYDNDNCLNPKKRFKCNYKNLRSHFVDSRFIQNGNFLESTNKLGYLILDLRKDFTEDELYNDYMIKHFYTIAELSKLNTYEKIADYILELSMTIPIIKKEIHRSDLSEFLIIKNLRSSMIKEYKRMVKIQNWNLINWTSWKNIKQNIELLIHIEVPVTDIYTISRMFKTFKKSKYFPSKQMNIIYYAGNYHADLVRNFLSSLLFSTHICRYMNIDNWTRCLDVSGIQINFL